MTEATPTQDPAVRRLRLRYAGTCGRCGAGLAAGSTASYDKAAKAVFCLDCPPPTPDPAAAPTAATDPAPTPDAVPVPAEPPPEAPYSMGRAAGGALREYHRRHDAREDRIRLAHPRTAGLRLALSDDPQPTRAWARGAVGELRLGGHLDALAGPTLRVLHDRRIPGSRANIDHIVIAPAGVFVVDAKRYLDQRPALRVDGGLLRPRVERLIVGGLDRTKLVDAVRTQVGRVRAALVEATAVPVHGVLCFLDADFPVIGGDFSISGVTVVWPKRLSTILLQPGPLDEPTIAELQRTLAAALPAYEPPPGTPGEEAEHLAEPPRRRLLPHLIRPLISLAMLGLLAWSASSGALATLAGLAADAFMSVLSADR